MRTLAKTAVALGFIGATAIGTTATVQAQGYYGYGYYPHPYYHRHYPRYYGYQGGYYGGGTFNGCPPGWTIQGGNCAPYKGPRGPFVPPGAGYWWQ
jgi:hypothetical protein